MHFVAGPAMARSSLLDMEKSSQYLPGGSLRTKETSNGRKSTLGQFARARVNAHTMVWGTVGRHEPTPRVCMSIHPEGKSCSDLRCFSWASFEGQF